MDTRKSLTSWSNTFLLSANHVKNEATGTLVTSDALKREENFAKASKAYQTPKRRKFEEVVPNLNQSKRYETILKDKDYGFGQIESILRQYDDSIETLSSQVHRLQMVQRFFK